MRTSVGKWFTKAYPVHHSTTDMEDMQMKKIPVSLVIYPEIMIQDLRLKGVDLLVYAFCCSVYKLTAKAVVLNKTYLSMLTGYSRRQVIRCVEGLVKRGILRQFGSTYIPVSYMSKGSNAVDVKKCHTDVKKCHTDVKKCHTMINNNDLNNDKKENFIKEDFDMSDEAWEQFLKDMED